MVKYFGPVQIKQVKILFINVAYIWYMYRKFKDNYKNMCDLSINIILLFIQNISRILIG